MCRALALQLARGLAHLHAHGAAHGCVSSSSLYDTLGLNVQLYVSHPDPIPTQHRRVALDSVVLGPAKYPWQARLRLLPPPAPSVAAMDGEEGEAREAGEGEGDDEVVATPEEDVHALALLIRQVTNAFNQPKSVFRPRKVPRRSSPPYPPPTPIHSCSPPPSPAAATAPRRPPRRGATRRCSPTWRTRIPQRARAWRRCWPTRGSRRGARCPPRTTTVRACTALT